MTWVEYSRQPAAQNGRFSPPGAAGTAYPQAMLEVRLALLVLVLIAGCGAGVDGQGLAPPGRAPNEVPLPDGSTTGGDQLLVDAGGDQLLVDAGQLVDAGAPDATGGLEASPAPADAAPALPYPMCPTNLDRLKASRKCQDATFTNRLRTPEGLICDECETADLMKIGPCWATARQLGNGCSPSLFLCVPSCETATACKPMGGLACN